MSCVGRTIWARSLPLPPQTRVVPLIRSAWSSAARGVEVPATGAGGQAVCADRVCGDGALRVSVRVRTLS